MSLHIRQYTYLSTCSLSVETYVYFCPAYLGDLSLMNRIKTCHLLPVSGLATFWSSADLLYCKAYLFVYTGTPFPGIGSLATFPTKVVSAKRLASFTTSALNPASFLSFPTHLYVPKVTTVPDNDFPWSKSKWHSALKMVTKKQWFLVIWDHWFALSLTWHPCWIWVL